MVSLSNVSLKHGAQRIAVSIYNILGEVSVNADYDESI